jgi:hypothetical protein
MKSIERLASKIARIDSVLEIERRSHRPDHCHLASVPCATAATSAWGEALKPGQPAETRVAMQRQPFRVDPKQRGREITGG